MKTIYIDTNKLNQEFEHTLDEVYMAHHYHQTHIPKGLTGDLQRVDLSAVGRTPVNGIPAGMVQDGEGYHQVGGGEVSSGCVVVALTGGVIIALLILAAGL